MKTVIRCSLTQWKITRALTSGAPLSASMTNHLDSCNRCRAFYVHSQELDRRLAQARKTSPENTPDCFEEKLLQTVHSVSSNRTGPEYSGLRLQWAATGVAVLAMASAATWFFLRQPVKITEEKPAAPTSDELLLTSPDEELLSSEYAKLEDDLLAIGAFLGNSLEQTLPFESR